MNPVLLSLSLLAFIAISFLPFVHFAPNRFVGGEAQTLWQLSSYAWLLLAGFVGLFGLALAWPKFKAQHITLLVSGLIGLLLVLLFALLAHSSSGLMENANAAARVSIGSGFWVAFLLLVLCLLDAWQNTQTYRAFIVVVALALLAVFFLAFAAQWFDELSLVKEYRNHHQRFSSAFLQHIFIVFVAFIPTLLLGLLLGFLVWRFARLNAAFFGVLNFLQTIPSIALFALLMAPLSWLATHYPALKSVGISGIGIAPAVIALILYTLLPLVRNTYAGLAAVPAAAQEAARGMGMTRWQIFVQVMVPLALPVVLSGVRIVIVQAIGLTVVAALIGAGGLGVFVWEGLGQYALDLVLLGALPTIFLALCADLILQGVVWFSQPIKTKGTTV